MLVALSFAVFATCAPRCILSSQLSTDGKNIRVYMDSNVSVASFNFRIVSEKGKPVPLELFYTGTPTQPGYSMRTYAMENGQVIGIPTAHTSHYLGPGKVTASCTVLKL
jgi:hypothetical protein